MSDNSSDDRFSMPPLEGVWAGRDTEPEADEPEEAARPEPRLEPESLPLPPPGLFARLDTPGDQPVSSFDDDLEPEEPAWRPFANLDDDEFAPTDAGASDEVAAQESGAAPLAGVADAVDIIEQLASEWREPEDEPDDAPSGDALVFADAAEALVEDDVIDEADEEPEAEPEPEPDEPAPAFRMPAYALLTGEETDEDATYERDASDEPDAPAFALPMYGDRAPDAAPDEEILPHFLLEETTPLDVISAQDELREMAQKGRRKSSDDDDHKPSLARTLAEIPILLVVAAVIAFLVKTFIAQAYYIPSGSMLPQLQIDDRVVVSKLAYKAHDPRRGDIIVFDDPKTGQSTETDVERTGVAKVLRKIGEGVGVVQPSTDEFIKRVIALPGERVEGRDGYVYINDHKLIEPYLPEGVRTDDFDPQTVAKGKLWVMGDNRSGSADSRVFGQIDVDSIVGRAVIKVWPFSHISFL